MELIDIKKDEKISAFKSQVLDIAKKQINDNTNIQFDYQLSKKGRAFHWITLYMNTQKFRQLEIDFEQSLDTQKFASKLRAYGFNEEQSNNYCSKRKRKRF